MKILYAIQGRDKCHISRAKEVIPALMKRAQVDILISGYEARMNLPFDINYNLKGINLFFTKSGRINYLKTLRKNNIFQIIRDIRSCEVHQYDMVINDSEPISAWACYFKNKICVSLSHQAIMLNKERPHLMKTGRLDRFVLRNYAPTVEDLGVYNKRFENQAYTSQRPETSQEQTRAFPTQTQALVDTILTNHIIATELSNEVFQGL